MWENDHQWFALYLKVPRQKSFREWLGRLFIDIAIFIGGWEWKFDVSKNPNLDDVDKCLDDIVEKNSNLEKAKK